MNFATPCTDDFRYNHTGVTGLGDTLGIRPTHLIRVGTGTGFQPRGRGRKIFRHGDGDGDGGGPTRGYGDGDGGKFPAGIAGTGTGVEILLRMKKFFFISGWCKSSRPPPISSV